jgi:multiple sugar transport system permease protein
MYVRPNARSPSSSGTAASGGGKVTISINCAPPAAQQPVQHKSRLRILWDIVLPISRPIIAVVSIFSLVAVWKDFLWPLLVEFGYSPTRETLNVGIWQGVIDTPPNLLIAASAIAAVPTIAFFLIFQRNIMAGLTAGGIRG